jgi:membrane protein YqaA with SNARE-associated domain
MAPLPTLEPVWTPRHKLTLPHPDRHTLMPTDLDAPPAPPAPSLSLRTLIIQTVVITALLVGAVVLASVFLREPLSNAADWVVNSFGLPGIALGIFISDTFTFPIPPDTYIFLAVASNLRVMEVLVTVCVVSVLAGNVAYFLGPLLTRVPFLNKKIEQFRPQGQDLFLRYGVWTVVIGALTPLPYSVVCWFAGLYKMPYGRFFFATLFRIPRMIGYYYLFKLGWV